MKELWDNYFDGYDMSDLFNSDEYWAKVISQKLQEAQAELFLI